MRARPQRQIEDRSAERNDAFGKVAIAAAQQPLAPHDQRDAADDSNAHAGGGPDPIIVEGIFEEKRRGEKNGQDADVVEPFSGDDIFEIGRKRFLRGASFWRRNMRIELRKRGSQRSGRRAARWLRRQFRNHRRVYLSDWRRDGNPRRRGGVFVRGRLRKGVDASDDLAERLLDAAMRCSRARSRPEDAELSMPSAEERVVSSSLRTRTSPTMATTGPPTKTKTRTRTISVVGASMNDVDWRVR